jgi:hypothetical protein
MRFSFIDTKKAEFPHQTHVQNVWRQPERVSVPGRIEGIVTCSVTATRSSSTS